MPPSGFNRKAVAGALQFVRACYEDLLEDVKTGKFGTYEEAIEHEMRTIDRALSDLHVQEGAES